jgi:hypothetical protein
VSLTEVFTVWLLDEFRMLCVSQELTTMTDAKETTNLESSTDLAGRLDVFVSLEYGNAIYSIFELMFEPWMDDRDKAEYMALALQAEGKTFADLDRELATGVANGYSVEQQVEICRKLFSGQPFIIQASGDEMANGNDR